MSVWVLFLVIDVGIFTVFAGVCSFGSRLGSSLRRFASGFPACGLPDLLPVAWFGCWVVAAIVSASLRRLFGAVRIGICRQWVILACFVACGVFSRIG